MTQIASLTRWTWVSVNFGSWWWTGRPGVLRFMGSQRVGHDWATDLIWSDDPEISLLGIYPEETKIEKNTCTPLFTVALFTIARTWKQPRCPLTDEWIKKLWYIYTMGYSVQVSSVTQSCPGLCDPMNCKHARPTCPSPTPRFHPKPHPLNQWFHTTISSTAVPFSSCLQSFPASGSF